MIKKIKSSIETVNFHVVSLKKQIYWAIKNKYLSRGSELEPVWEDNK